MPIVDRIFAASFVVGLLVLVVWALKRRGTPIAWPGWLKVASGNPRGESPRPIVVVQRTALTHQHCLHLVRVSGAEFLVATHPAGVAFSPLPEPFSQTLARSFGSAPQNPPVQLNPAHPDKEACK